MKYFFLKKIEKEKNINSKIQNSNSWIKKMLVRIFAGLTMLFIFIGIILTEYSREILCVFIIVAQTITFKEIIYVRYQSAKEKKLLWFRTWNWADLVVTFFFLYGYSVLEYLEFRFPNPILRFLMRYHMGISYSLYVIVFCGFIFTLKKDLYKYQFTQLAWTVMTLVLVVVQSHFIFYNIFEGLFWFVFPVSLIVVNDSMAYFSGLFFGKKFFKKKFISLSPNKTWEGFIGGAFCTIIWAWVFCYFLIQYPYMICPDIKPGDNITCSFNPVFLSKEYFINPKFIPLFEYIPYIKVSYDKIILPPILIHAFIFGLFASVIAPLGGFFASGMKRAYGIKDFNSLIPGHGGMMDRMDCQVVMALFVYVYYRTFIQTQKFEVEQIIKLITRMDKEEQMEIYQLLFKNLFSKNFTN
jgi:phosphatidate cytidylyltransferase